MRLLLVNIKDPSKEKLVTDILNEIEGVEVRRVPKEGKASKSGASRTTRSRRGTVAPVDAQEEKFIKGLTRAFMEMDEHMAGKRKLKTLKEGLDEL